MNTTQPDITALLGSRICHDLVSPLGAISNGVELLSMVSLAAGPEMDLISESVDNANARIRFFRVAYGVAMESQLLAATEVRSILVAIGQTSKITVNWGPDGDVSRQDAKLVFLMIQCFEAAMPWGGTLDINQQNRNWTMTGSSERMKLDQTLWDGLYQGDGRSDIRAAEVQFLLVPMVLQELGRNLSLQLDQNNVVARF